MPGWLRQTTGGLPRMFWYLWAGTLINRLGSFVIIFLAIYLTRALGFSQGEAGLVLGLGGAGGAVGTICGGVLADRWGRRPTLLTAQFGAAALMLALGFARGFWQLALGALLLGMFSEAARPAFSAMMIDIVPDRDRVRAYALNYWAINLGFAVAAVLAGFAAELNYLLLFLVDAGTTLITALISARLLRETRPRLRGHRHGRGTGSTDATGTRLGMGAVFRDRIFIGFVALNLPVVIVIMQHLSTLPIAMNADGLGPATFGWVIAVNGVLIVTGQLLVPRLIGDRNRSRVLALACLMTGVGFGVNAFADTALVFAAGVVIWTLGEMIQAPSNSALIAELSPAQLRGRYQGVNALSWSAAAALAPILGGFVQERLGDAVLWLGCATIGALVAGGQLLAGPARERRAAALREIEASTVSAETVGATAAIAAVGRGAPAAAGDTHPHRSRPHTPPVSGRHRPPTA